MATSYVGEISSLTIGGVDLTAQCNKVDFTVGQTALTVTAFGDAGERMTGGLQSVEGSLDLYAAYGAGEVESVLYDEVGTGTTDIVLTIKPGALSASNPEYTFTSTMIADYPLAIDHGQIQIFTVAFSGGDWSRDITP